MRTILVNIKRNKLKVTLGGTILFSVFVALHSLADYSNLKYNGSTPLTNTAGAVHVVASKTSAIAENDTDLCLCPPIEPSSRVVQSASQLKICPAKPPNLTGHLEINLSISLEDATEALKATVATGGTYEPSECLPRWKIAIIIGFRNREEQLGPFNYHLQKLLQKQQIDYSVYLVNQTDKKPFNRAKLFNVGFVEAKKDAAFDCFLFHDVDFLAEDDRHLYHCSDMPRHMTVYYKNHPYSTDKDLNRYFGGVVMLTTEHLELINGWSNLYWGWGGEDDDIKRRVLNHGLVIWSYPKAMATYKMLEHEQTPKNPIRYKLLKKSEQLMAKDGLNNLNYRLISKKKHPLFTSINVDIS